MNLQDPLTLEILYRIGYALAGAAGGAIRWWSAKSALTNGIAHLAIGAIAGFFLNGLMFAAIKPAVDWSGMSTFDGQLLGAHLAGVVGITLYAILPDLAMSWIRSKASTKPEEPTP